MNRQLIVILAAFGAAATVVGFSVAAISVPRAGAPPADAVAPASTKAVEQGGAANSLVSSPRSTVDSADVAAYWTKERMSQARPATREIEGGTPSTSKVPAVTGVPAGTTERAAKPAKTSSPSKSADSDGLVQGTDKGSSASEYWTPERMDDVSPIEKTVPGGDGAQDSPGPPVSGTPAGTP